MSAARERVGARVRVRVDEPVGEQVPGDQTSRTSAAPWTTRRVAASFPDMVADPGGARTHNRRMPGEKPIAENRKARHDYHFLERFEAGIVLTGSEVKSLRQGRVSLQQAYADVREGEAWLVGAHIDPYEQAGIQNHEPERDRKLLLHRRGAGLALRQGAREGPDARSRRASTSRTAARSWSSRSRGARSSATSGASSRSATPTARSSARSKRGAEPLERRRQLAHPLDHARRRRRGPGRSR